MLDIQALFHPVIVYLHHHPHSAGIIAFFIAFSEALAVIGTIFPGSVTMTAVGVLIGSGVIPAISTVIWAIIGAICGDFLSYIVGFHYKNRIHKIWPFTKHPKLLIAGEKFFHKHGGKSVIIGRFFGPVRSMVPLIAGTLKMRPLRFLIAAVPSATAWAILYMTPGILLGALSLELPPGLAIEFIASILVILVILILITWLIKLTFQNIAGKIDNISNKIWINLQQHKSSNWITRILTDPRHPENHRQLILLAYAIICGLLFLLTMAFAFSHATYPLLNYPIHYLFFNTRNQFFDYIALFFTMLGQKGVMFGAAGLILIWLLIKRFWRTAAHWAALVFLVAGSVKTFKFIFYSPRPGGLLHGPTSSSFPSGHTTLATALLGFLAVLIAQELNKENRRYAYITASTIAALVALSRVFLGAHWPTDIIGGAMLGITIVLLTTISYRRSNMPELPIKPFCVAIIVIFFLIITPYSLHYWKKLKHNYTPFWHTIKISYKKWQQRPNDFLPLYRSNRLGHPVEIFNVEWLGHLANIRQQLQQQGWQNHEPKLNLKGIVLRLNNNAVKHQLPLLPQLYHNKAPKLLMTKNDKNNKVVILRLWRSWIHIKHTKQPLWLGIVNYHHAPYKLLTPHKHFTMHKFFFGATDQIAPDLKKLTWKAINYPREQQPKIAQKLNWDGKLLLITSGAN